MTLPDESEHPWYRAEPNGNLLPNGGASPKPAMVTRRGGFGDPTCPSGSGGRCARTTPTTATRGTTSATTRRARARTARARTGSPGISDERQLLCFALALWNGRDPILKERLFGLTNGEGNHGEDVKEYYFYVDATPTHSYLRFSTSTRRRPSRTTTSSRRTPARTRTDPEYELLDTGVFDDDRYFDVEWNTPRPSPTTSAIRITVTNRGPEPARHPPAADALVPQHLVVGRRRTAAGDAWDGCRGNPGHRGLTPRARRVLAEVRWRDALLFTENETNSERLGGPPNRTPFVKDGIGRYVIDGDPSAVNSARVGTKAAAHYQLSIEPGASVTISLWLNHAGSPDGPSAGDVATVIDLRRAEADAFYATVIPPSLDEDQTRVMRQALAGMIWSKQTYQYDVHGWLGDHGVDPLRGDAADQPPAPRPGCARRGTTTPGPWRQTLARCRWRA